MQALEQYLQERQEQVTHYSSFTLLPHTEHLQIVILETEAEHIILEPRNGDVSTYDVYMYCG